MVWIVLRVSLRGRWSQRRTLERASGFWARSASPMASAAVNSRSSMVSRAKAERGGGDVAFDVGGFAFEFVGVDGEALDSGGEDGAADDAGQDQDHDGGDGEAESFVERPGEDADDDGGGGDHFGDLGRGRGTWSSV